MEPDHSPDRAERRYRNVTMFIIMLGVIMASVDTTAVVLALPTISYLYLYATLGGEFAPEARFWTAVGLAVPLLAWAFLIDFTIPGPAVAAVALIWWLHHLRRRLRAGTRGPAVIRGPSAPAA